MKKRSMRHRSSHGYIVLSYIELHSQRQTWTFYIHIAKAIDICIEINVFVC
jgi:hypothetical protein